MATDIVVPTLGESVTEATVARWLKQPGEAVKMDEALVELETDKVTLEVNAASAGVLTEIVVPQGETVEVGALLGRLEVGAAATAAPAPSPAPAPAKAPPKTAESAVPPPKPGKGIDTGPEPVVARDKAKAAEPAAPAPAPAPSKAGGAPSDSKPVEIKVPTLGESVSEAIVARWIRQAGDAVAVDEPIVELETDKVTLEVNAPVAGILGELKVAAGATVEVGTLLASIAPGAQPGAKTVAPTLATIPENREMPDGDTAVPQPDAPPAAAPAKPAAPLDPRQVARSALGGRIGASDLLSFITGQPLSPAVAKLVAENDLDPGRIPASGKDGRLTKDDVQQVLRNPGLLKPAPMANLAKPGLTAPGGAKPSPAPAPSPTPAGEAHPREERVKMTKLRQTIARRLKEAQNTAAMLTTFNEVDMSAVMALRSAHKEAFEKKHGVKLGFTSFFAKACVAALKDVPGVNGRIEGDEIVYAHHYDLGMAVSTPAGLMVPVIRDCDTKSFAEIEQELGALAAKARDGKLSLPEMQGGTFTITNGGVFGSLLSTPILNPPQSAILGLHKIEERPIALKGQVVIRPMMYLAVSYDHRLVDGREAVTFLVKVKEAIEEPERLLLGL